MACLWIGAGRAYAVTVLVVAGEHSAASIEVTEAMFGVLERTGMAKAELAQISVDEVAGIDLVGPSAPKILVTLGTNALQKVLARESRLPVLAALIPRGSFERVVRDSGKRSSVTLAALYLDQPWDRQLDMVRLALPDAHRVGILFGAESVIRKPALASALQERGLEMVSSVAPDGSSFPPLGVVLESADVLLAVPDTQVFNSSSISNLLLSTYRAHIPMVAFSPAYVKAGALLSLHSTPSQIGVQSAGIARSLLAGAVVAPAQYPLEFTVTVNEQVARSLGLQINAAALSERLRRMERKP
ncbi:hypothetical protein RS694_07485 [Rhodoferax saidenbachensis]|uniref:ABC transporter substrate-binding protein n=2 Tax=Rhodoferax saidenbachensis TaxID=1484693 RepID=A0A1P8K8S0_9BURK|nr:hypothetical protein RS694_07485 [Rhodoferax saidenbachensis]